MEDGGAPSTDESSRAARLLAEPFCDEGLLLAVPLAATASLSLAVMAAVSGAGSAGLPLSVAR